MDDAARKKPDIDVLENVFGGVHISTEDEERSPAPEPDIRARPWLAGLTMSAVQVTLTEDDQERPPGNPPEADSPSSARPYGAAPGRENK